MPTLEPWDTGWLRGARKVASPNEGPRPPGTAVELLVVHSISLPPGQFGGDEIERLFTNTLDCDAHPYFDRLRGVAVSAHFLIRRQGELVQFVDTDRRAWHAGASEWRGRANCNDYSIGVELEGLEGGLFEAAQYDVLSDLCHALASRYAISAVTGHEHIAPGRKQDPGPGFNWSLLAQKTGWSHRCFPEAPTII